MWSVIACLILCFGTITLHFSRRHLRTLLAIPGPATALTPLSLRCQEFKGRKTAYVASLHRRYGPVLRITPNEVSFTTPSAVSKIYTTLSEKTAFYDIFIVYNERTHFTMMRSYEHKSRKRSLASLYSMSAILNGPTETLIDTKVEGFINSLDNQHLSATTIFKLISPLILDTMTGFIYGNLGATDALESSQDDQINNDLKAPERRLLFFSFNQFPTAARWITYAINKLGMSSLVPTSTYSQILDHGWRVWESFDRQVASSGKIYGATCDSVMAQAHKAGLDGKSIGAECTDHLLAAIIALDHVLISALWVLSKPSNRLIQRRLRHELQTLNRDDLDSARNPTNQACAKLPYLNAIMKETLRLYPPFSGSQPRTFRADVSLDGYVIPAGTVVSMNMYAMHRDPTVFPEPEDFQPERWLDEGRSREMDRYFLPFSAGDRRCTGEQ